MFRPEEVFRNHCVTGCLDGHSLGIGSLVSESWFVGRFGVNGIGEIGEIGETGEIGEIGFELVPGFGAVGEIYHMYSASIYCESIYELFILPNWQNTRELF